MKDIKPSRTKAHNEREDWFNPDVEGNGKLVCCCGFELTKESEDTYRCSGGNHRYNFNDDDVMVDKFGNILMLPKEK